MRGGEKEEKSWKTCISLLVQLQHELHWGLLCVSMCHSKSAQLSHSGWESRRTKGWSHKGSRGGEESPPYPPPPGHRGARKHCGQAGVRLPRKEGRQKGRGKPERQPRGERRRQVSPRKSDSKMMTLGRRREFL